MQVPSPAGDQRQIFASGRYEKLNNVSETQYAREGLGKPGKVEGELGRRLLHRFLGLNPYELY